MKKLYFAFPIFLLLTLSISIFGQEPQPDSAPPQLEETIRISSKLVLVDALVLDKDNKQVTDLSAEDFEVYQDGKLQEITSFTYVSGETIASNTEKRTDKKSKNLPVPPTRVRSPNEGRVITFVIDDGNCLATPEGIINAKKSMRKFIDERMLPNDKVAIYRTQGGSSLLQMYTSDKEVLKRLVNKARWTPSACGSAFDPARDQSTLKANGKGATSFESEETKEFKKGIADDARENQVIGSIGVLGFVIDRLKVLPERKIVFFISEGIVANLGDRSFSALREVSDKASRSSVAIYTMNSRGMLVGGSVAADDILPGLPGGEFDNTGNLANARIEEQISKRSTLVYLADQTGGEYAGNKAFLSGEIEKILEKETGYYLLGYQPESETFSSKDFHNIDIKLKRDDLKISSRKGFYGREEKESGTRYKNANNPLYQAIASPFAENGIDIRLTTLVGNDPQKGNYIRSLFHINGEDLTFIDEPNGFKKIVLDVVAVTLDEKGGVVEEFNHTYPIRIPQQGVETVKRNGLDYSADIPIKKPGFYSFRLAVRDVESNRLASAGDFVEIPKIKKDKLFMSGLVTTNIDNSGKPILPEDRPAKKAFAPVFVTSIPSIRKHLVGSDMAYSYNIYNAKLDKATNKPSLTKQIRIYKNGELLIEGKETPIELKAKADLSRIQDEGVIKLNQAVLPDEYILQIIIKDKVADKTDSQWIDFEVVQ